MIEDQDLILQLMPRILSDFVDFQFHELGLVQGVLLGELVQDF